jgi:ribosomal protein S18 acetylase RimI-like enzyme
VREGVTLRHAETDEDVAACFPVMLDLRPHIADAQELIRRVHRQRSENYHLLAAWRGHAVVGLAGYRFQELLIHGPFVYVDDLVVAAAERRHGLGARLLDEVSAIAGKRGCSRLVLDTAIDNSLGQRFYFRYGMLARGLRFSMPLTTA